MSLTHDALMLDNLAPKVFRGVNLLGVILALHQPWPTEADNHAYAAVEAGDVALLRKSLAQGADPDFYTWDRGYLVSAAVLQDKPEVLQVLINAGADVNVRKWNQSTPLLRAVHSSRCEAARLLLKAGASLDDRFYDYAELAEAPTYDKRTVREIYEGRKAEYPTSWERDAACWLQFEALMKNPPRSQWTLHRVFQQVVLLFI